jgi:hypothetical protein
MALTKVRRGGTDTGISDSSDATAITINSSEHVGIGTTSPSHELHITGSSDTRAIITSGGSGDAVMMFENASGNTWGHGLDLSSSNYVIGYNASGDPSLTSDGLVNITTSGQFMVGTTDTSIIGDDSSDDNSSGVHLEASGKTSISVNASDVLRLNRMGNDGTVIEIRGQGTKEGGIDISSTTVSVAGFSGQHESSGISTNTPIGTVVSTIDELDVYPSLQDGETHPKAGQTRADHAKIKVSDAVGDKRVYGVVDRHLAQDKVMVAAVGIASIRVTGACEGGDLLESNGDGTAKVQSDDAIKSKTIGKVTIGNSNAGVKLVSCVLYCG